jgi:hypothetical protein
MSLDLWMYGSGPQNKSNAMSTVPILYEFNVTEFMSFTEIEYQIMGRVQEIKPEAISRAIAEIAGMVYRSKIVYCKKQPQLITS